MTNEGIKISNSNSNMGGLLFFLILTFMAGWIWHGGTIEGSFSYTIFVFCLFCVAIVCCVPFLGLLIIGFFISGWDKFIGAFVYLDATHASVLTLGQAVIIGGFFVNILFTVILLGWIWIELKS